MLKKLSGIENYFQILDLIEKASEFDSTVKEELNGFIEERNDLKKHYGPKYISSGAGIQIESEINDYIEYMIIIALSL
ncbi:MAG: hypothetical protein COA44_04670 [Arcobacter sp.]|nr:MAG: hypothetical protein COA44_04670 [Arcobacter sp.]